MDADIILSIVMAGPLAICAAAWFWPFQSWLDIFATPGRNPGKLL